MYSDSGQHNKAHLLIRIKKRYASLAGQEMAAGTFAQLKEITFENALDLLGKLTKVEEDSLPADSVDVLVMDSLGRSTSSGQ